MYIIQKNIMLYIKNNNNKYINVIKMVKINLV